MSRVAGKMEVFKDARGSCLQGALYGSRIPSYTASKEKHESLE